VAPDQPLGARLVLGANAVWLVAAAAGFGFLSVLISYATTPAAVPITFGGAAFVLLALWRVEYGLAILLALAVLAGRTIPLPEGREEARILMEVLSSVPFWLFALASIHLGRALVTRSELRAPPIALSLALFLGLSLFSFVGSPDRAEGAVSLFLLVSGVAVYLLAALFTTEFSQRRFVISASLAIGLAVSLHAIWQYETGDLSRIGFISPSGAVQYRVTSTFVHPTMLGIFLSLTIPVAIASRRLTASRALRALALGAIPLALLGILVTYSRGTLVALAVLPFVYARGRRAIPILAVAAVLVVLLAPSAWQDRVTGSQDFSSPEIASRFDLWEAALEEFGEAPAGGVGLGAYGEAYVDLEESGKGFPPGETTFAVPLHAHNLYLNTLAEQGLVGAGALVLVLLAAARLVLVLRRSKLEENRVIGQMLLGLAVLVSVQAVFDKALIRDLPTTLAVGILFGVGASALIAERRNET
jgi:O-antigen ligase